MDYWTQKRERLKNKKENKKSLKDNPSQKEDLDNINKMEINKIRW